MINNIQKHQFKLFFSLTFLLFLNFLCGQNSTKKSIKNNSLPKEIHLNINTKKIIENIYVVKNGIQKLETEQSFEFKNAILISANRKYYVNDTLNQTNNKIFDLNGNNIESNTLLHFKNSSQKFKTKLDKYGNITKLEAKEKDKINILDYHNSYVKNKLVSIVVISNKNGNIIEKTSFKYDSKGNLIEEHSKKSYLESKNLYTYNKYNQVILYKHIRNGVKNDSTIYYYNKALLIKKEWYIKSNPDPIVSIYNYNLKNQLILESEEKLGIKIAYKNYDSDGNWLVKELYNYGKLSVITKRIFIK